MFWKLDNSNIIQRLVIQNSGTQPIKLSVTDDIELDCKNL